jgi:hypothetical protein
MSLSATVRRVLFGPCRDYARAFLNRPFIFAIGNNGEAGALSILPDCAITLCIELPRAGAFVARLRDRLTGHFSVRRKGHFELGAAGCGGGERLAIEKGRFDIVRSHALRSEGNAGGEKYANGGERSCALQEPRGIAISHCFRTIAYLFARRSEPRGSKSRYFTTRGALLGRCGGRHVDPHLRLRS